MVARQEVRRPTESSKAAASTSGKSLSAVSLTKKTNSLVFDVQELKNSLQVHGREVAQRDETLDELVTKVNMLQDAFNSLSDVFTCELEEIQKQFAATTSELRGRVDRLEASAGQLEAQVPRIDGKRRQLQESTERRFLVVQDTCSKLEMALYETQAELALVKNSADDLLTREREAAHLQQSLQSSQDDTADWLRRLKQETGQLQVDLFALKEEASGATTTMAGDVQMLAKEHSALRSTISKQHAQWLSKLSALQEAVDRQGQMDKAQLSQRVDALSDAVATHEMRTKDAVDNLLKNHSRIRCAVDEGMSLCSREIRALGNETRAAHADHQEKLDQIVEQIATNSIECGQKHDDLRLSLRSVGQQLRISL